MESIENIKKAGLKLTPQRTAVYKTMMKLGHARLEEIVAHLHAEDETMTLSTVYRVLQGGGVGIGLPSRYGGVLLRHHGG